MEEKAKKPTQRNRSHLAVANVKSKTIKTGRGRLVKQYPANPGFHGSENEKQLNPEE